jgi:iron complex transport system ATP-binding protein
MSAHRENPAPEPPSSVVATPPASTAAPDAGGTGIAPALADGRDPAGTALATPAPALAARGLGCVREGRRLLEGIDLELRPGDLLGIIGPNGAGKSTLLKCLSGLLPACGEILVGDRPLAGLCIRQRARHLALMHQDTSLGFPFSAREVVMMGRHPHQGRLQAESARDRELADAAMEFTDTARLAGQAVTRMSGGERQRVLFAKALAQDTPILLLDEPTANLDISFQEQIFTYARHLAGQGRAVAAAVHDLRIAGRYCTTLLLLAQGRVLAAGPAEAVLTPELLTAAYGVNVRVYRNHITGLLDYHLHDPDIEGSMPHVHVIGGGGSAAGVLRLLGDDGYRVTAGVLAPGDSDLLVAGAYGMPVVTSQPFSAIGDAAFRDSCQLASRADLTILCNLAFGPLNLRNLESALCARRLLVIEDDGPESRDFTGGGGLELYRRLVHGATVLHGSQLREWLAAWRQD